MRRRSMSEEDYEKHLAAYGAWLEAMHEKYGKLLKHEFVVSEPVRVMKDSAVLIRNITLPVPIIDTAMFNAMAVTAMSEFNESLRAVSQGIMDFDWANIQAAMDADMPLEGLMDGDDYIEALEEIERAQARINYLTPPPTFDASDELQERFDYQEELWAGIFRLLLAPLHIGWGILENQPNILGDDDDYSDE